MKPSRFSLEPKVALSLAAGVAIGGARSLQQARRARKAEDHARITEKTAEEAMYLATHDQLTGEFNRYGLRRLLDGHKPPRAMLYVDGTNQKAINDNIGHDRGDEAIIGTAKVIKKSLRPGDIMARIGGDEFLVLLDTKQRKIPEPLSPDELLAPVMQRIHDRAQTYVDDNPDLKAEGFDIAVGGVVWRRGMSIEDMEVGAEAAMYDVKAAQHEANGSHR